MVIYKITNTINNKVYIGQTTTTLQQRWRSHRNSKTNCVFHKAIRKYGSNNFTVEQIDSASNIEELNEKERYWIEYYNSTLPNGYNSTNGGNNYTACLEVKKKLSEKRTGENNPNYGKDFNGENNPFYGKKHTKETRKKLSEFAKTRTGENNPFYRHSPTEKQKETHWKKVKCIETGEIFLSMTEACRKYNIDVSTMSKVVRGIEGKTCKGYHWEYVSD